MINTDCNFYLVYPSPSSHINCACCSSFSFIIIWNTKSLGISEATVRPVGGNPVGDRLGGRLGDSNPVAGGDVMVLFARSVPTVPTSPAPARDNS
ncbi:MAG: hypothetical protein RM811_012180 [Endozoicomonas sp.]